MAGYYNNTYDTPLVSPPDRRGEDRHEADSMYSENPLFIADEQAYTETQHYRNQDRENDQQKEGAEPSDRKLKSSNPYHAGKDEEVKMGWTAKPEDKDDDVESEVLFKCPISLKKDRPKYLVVKTFRKRVYVDVREYFVKNKEILPTKKGLTLTMAEFQALCRERLNVHKAVQGKFNRTIDGVRGLAQRSPAIHPSTEDNAATSATVSEPNVTSNTLVRDVGTKCNLASHGVHAASDIENRNWSDDEDFVITNPKTGRGQKRRQAPSFKKVCDSKSKKSKLSTKTKNKTNRLKRSKRKVLDSPQPIEIQPERSNVEGERARFNADWDIPAPAHHTGPGTDYVSSHVPPPHVNYFFSSDEEEEAEIQIRESTRTVQRGGMKINSNPETIDKTKGGKRKTKSNHLPPNDLQNDESSGPNIVHEDSSIEDEELLNAPRWQFVDSRISKRFGVRESWYDFVGDIQNCTSICDVLYYIESSLDELRTLLLRDTSERDFVRLVLVSEQLNVPIGFPWAMIKDFDINAILERIERVLNSNQDFILKPGFTIRFHHVLNPVGGYVRKMDGLRDGEASLRKRSIITIPSSKADKTCFANALVIARYYANNNIKYKQWSRTDREPTARLQKEAAKLHELAGVEVGEVDSTHYARFQEVLHPEYRLVIYRGRKRHAMIYAGPPAEKTLYLYLTESSHYNVIKNMSAFLCAKNYCKKCLEVFNDPRYHECCETCPDCFSDDCDRND
eukprot:XP_011682593.1 PREDICTED: uncharacterized protein LOC105446895 [Strongylocentrotus purpuratus]